MEYSLIDSNDMSKYTLTKVYDNMSTQTNTSSLPHGHSTSISMFYKCEYKIPPKFVPHVLKHKKVYATFLKRSCPLELQRTHI